MTLEDLIKALGELDPELLVPWGFTNPHSYRGFYEDLAFEPAENVSFGAMLADAQKARGTTYVGYKGGNYEMKDYTDVWIAPYGSEGEGIGPTLIRYMALAAMRVTTNDKQGDASPC